MIRTCAMALLLSFAVGSDTTLPIVSGGSDEKESCAVHNNGLIRGTARMAYHFVPPDDDYVRAYRAAKGKEFPNSNLEFNGGCTGAPRGYPEITDEVEVTYCPKCRAAEEKWLTEHPRK